MVDSHVVSGHSASMTFVPDAFLPVIGLVMVTHAFMDNKLQEAICFVGGIDYNVGVSFLSEMQMTSKRSDIFRNLAKVKENNLSTFAKMLVLADLVYELSTERNTIAHSVPYWTNYEKTEMGYFKDVVKTSPQIARKPPYIATIDSLTRLARQMELVGVWLGMIVPSYLPEDVGVAGKSAEEVRVLLKCQPRWLDDAHFPWPDKLRSKLENVSQNPLNGHRTPTRPPLP